MSLFRYENYFLLLWVPNFAVMYHHQLCLDFNFESIYHQKDQSPFFETALEIFQLLNKRKKS